MKTTFDLATGQVTREAPDPVAYDLDTLKALRLAWNDRHRATQLAGLSASPVTLNGQPYTLSDDPVDIEKLVKDIATASLGTTVNFPTTAGAIPVPVADAEPIGIALKAIIQPIETAWFNYKIAVKNAATAQDLPPESWS